MPTALCSRSVIAAISLAVASSACAQSFADFEGLSEGFHGKVVTYGGITFTDPDDRLDPPGSQIWAIDDGTEIWDLNPGMLSFVSGKTLQINGYSGGPGGYAFLRAGSMKMSTGRVETEAAVSVTFVSEDISSNWSLNTITLEAIRNDVVVATDEILLDNAIGTSKGGSFTFGADRLEVSGVAFDRLRLVSSGPTQDGAWLGGIDNVSIAPAPGGLAAVGLFGMVMVVRRRRGARSGLGA